MRFRNFLFVLLALTSVLKLTAVDEIRNARLNGTFVSAGNQLTVKDDKFPSPYLVGWQNAFAFMRSKAKVEFGLNEDKHIGYSQDYNVEITFNVIATDANNVQQIFNNQTLKISYKANGTYKDKAQYNVGNYSKLNVSVVSILVTNTAGSPISYVPKDLFLEAEIATSRNYLFFPSQTPNALLMGNKYNLPCVSANNELLVYWNYVPGVEEYELEWTWVNGYAGSAQVYDFKYDATRVVTKNSYYNIPLVYENGYILYRLRHIGRGGVNMNERVEGPWTAFPEKGFVSAYPTNMKYNTSSYSSDNINWSSTLTFDENGRKGSGVSFMDGMLMGRQSIAKLNTENKIIAQSVIYDYQGRPAISVLPVPISGDCKPFQYQQGLNLNSSSTNYSEPNFDVDATNTCANTANPINVIAGASNYYSSSNDNKEGAQGYLPVADGLPYVQVEYMNDMTGRIKSQTMPGEAHKLDNGKQTDFFYSNPGSSELMELFGSEVGNVKHYDKNIVKDANGQLSASYIDMEGRVIATSLLGPTPLNVDPIEGSNDALPQKDNLALSNIKDENNYTLSSTKNIFIDQANSVQDFTYEMTPEDFTDACASGFCFDCIYELEIKITDLCNANIIAPQTYVIGNITPATPAILGSCDAPPVNFAITPSPLQVTFPKIGSYVVTKTLKVSDINIDEYTKIYLANNTCFKSYAQILAEQIASIDASSCNTDCQSCLTSVNAYVTSHPGLSQQVIDDLTADCDILCANAIDPCAATKETMLQDFLPTMQTSSQPIVGSGQYASFFKNSVTGVYFSSGDPTSIFTSPNKLGVAWNTPGLALKNEDGSLSYINVYRNNQLVSLLATDPSITMNEFIDHFQRSWGNTFLPYHPEKCYLDFCYLNANSDKYDYGMLQVNTYSEALQKGYLKPLASVNLPASTCVAPITPVVNYDPFFTSTGQGNNGNNSFSLSQVDQTNFMLPPNQTYNSLMVSALTSHFPISPIAPNAPISGPTDIYSLAIKLSAGTAYPFGCDNCTKDQEWLMFRALYQALKMRLVAQRKTDYVITNGCFNGCMVGSGISPFYENGFNPTLTATSLNFTPYTTIPTPFASPGIAHPYYSFSGYPIVKAPVVAPVTFIGLLHDAYNNVTNLTTGISPCSNVANNDFDIKQAHFIQMPFDPNSILSQMAGDPNAPGSGSFSNPPPVNVAGNYCDNTCNSYVASWVDKLKNCNAIFDLSDPLANIPSNVAIRNALMADLVNVCKNGCDPQNPYGSSSINPASSATAPYYDFQSVINHYASLYPTIIPYSNSAECSALVLDFPEPYNHDYNGTGPGGNVLQTCGCDKLIKTKQDFIAFGNNLPSGITTVEQYYESLYGNPIFNFNDLACKCEAAVASSVPFIPWTPNYVWNATQVAMLHNLSIPVPEELQCNKVCLPCSTIVSAINNFNNGNSTFLNSPDYNSLLENGLNASLNMNLTATDYLDFYNGCSGNGTSSQCNSASAATQMQALINTYLNIITTNPAPFSTFFNISNFPGLFGTCLSNCSIPPTSVKITIANDPLTGLPDYDHPVFVYSGPGEGDCKQFTCNLSFNILNNLLDPGFGASNLNVTSVVFSPLLSGYNSHPIIQYIRNGVLVTNPELYFNYPCLNSNYTNPSSESPTTLCNQPFTPTAPLYDDCLSSMMNQAQTNAHFLYDSYVQQFTALFSKKYKDKCILAKEKFERNYSANEYHYTLYYYDQAGNLTRTVPPKGVHKITPAQVAQLEANPLSPIYPSHNYVTNYKYQSYGAPLTSVTPDEQTAGVPNPTDYYYDRVGRIQVSQNAKQKGVNDFSYTLYDDIGRIKEVGVFGPVLPAGIVTIKSQIAIGDFEIYVNSVPTITKREVIKTYYDEPINAVVSAQFLPLGQINLRNRVATVTYENTDDFNNNTYTTATHYTYDEHGNVYELIQDLPALAALGKQYTHFDYNYDLISGNVNKVTYQKGGVDQFIHKYEYDNDNRLHNVYTSKDEVNWDRDAKYFYYEHGPLARTEIGDQKVQGTDFAYTIHGWIKAVNSNLLSENTDMGKDGAQGNQYLSNYANLHQFIGKDAAGYSLNYYQQGTLKDYQAIKSGNFNTSNNQNMIASTANISTSGSFRLDADAPDLFNGNISSMVTSIYDMDASTYNTHAQNTVFPQITGYRYDQLHRIMQMKAFRDISLSGNSWNPSSASNYDGSYFTQFTYDKNGNIEKQRRDGAAFLTGFGLPMDNLKYKTQDGSATNPTNKLIRVNDAAGGAYTTDIKETIGNPVIDEANTATYDYEYDAIGSLIKDKKEFIDVIEWTVDRKVKKVKRDIANMVSAGKNMPDLEFVYDANRQRIAKIVKPHDATTGALLSQDNWVYTVYSRDASGNIASTYQVTYVPAGVNTFTEKLTLQEHDIYGSARLGTIPSTDIIKTRNFTATLVGGLFQNKTYLPDAVPPPNCFMVILNPYTLIPEAVSCPSKTERNLGTKRYELTNHLGNVLTVVSDRKLQQTGNISGMSNDFEAPFAQQAASPSPLMNTGFTCKLVPSAFAPALSIPVNQGDNVSASVDAFHFLPTSANSSGLLIIQFVDAYGNFLAPGGATQWFSTPANTANVLEHLSLTKTVPTIAGYTGQIYAQSVLWNPNTNDIWFDNHQLDVNYLTPNVASYKPEILETHDYYSFGMDMPGRNVTPIDAYRFGNNGKEKDNEMYNGAQDFGERMYENRLGKWMSTDPLKYLYPSLSPYASVANSPIVLIDQNGEKIFIYYDSGKKDKDGNIVFTSYEYGSSIKLPNNKYVKKTVKTLNHLQRKNRDPYHIVETLAGSETENIAITESNSWYKIGAFIIEVGQATIMREDGTIISDGDQMNMPDIISWCLNSGYINEEGKERQSAATGLLHELAHKYYYFCDPLGKEKEMKDIMSLPEGEDKELKIKDYLAKQKEEVGDYHTYADKWIIQNVETKMKEGIRKNHTDGYFLKTRGGTFSTRGRRYGRGSETGKTSKLRSKF